MSKGGNSECSEDDKLRSGCSSDAEDDPLLKSLEWDVPVLNDSLLYKCKMLLFIYLINYLIIYYLLVN